MTLSSMVVSRDWQEVSVLRMQFWRLAYRCCRRERTATSSVPALELKDDALIVDCDLNGTGQLLPRTAKGGSAREYGARW